MFFLYVLLIHTSSHSPHEEKYITNYISVDPTSATNQSINYFQDKNMDFEGQGKDRDDILFAASENELNLLGRYKNFDSAAALEAQHNHSILNSKMYNKNIKNLGMTTNKKIDESFLHELDYHNITLPDPNERSIGVIPLHNIKPYRTDLNMSSYMHNFYQRSTEELLYENIFTNYLKELRPVKNSNETLMITIDLVLQRILALEDSNQILIAAIWLRLKWTDRLLSWDPALYNGIKKMLFPSSRLWLPDIVLYNNVDKDLFKRNLITNVRIDHTGAIEWDSPLIVKAQCQLNVAKFPFDKQTCNLVFGSWTYDSRQLDLRADRDSANVTDYKESSTWRLIRPVRATKNMQKYSCCDYPFINLTYTINIERKATYYFVNLITPCVLVSVLAPLSFTVPIESSSRVHMSLSLFLSVTMFLVLLTRVIPAAEEVSIISIYYVGSMGVMAGSSILCIFTVGLQQQGQIVGDIPEWMQKIFLERIAKFVFLGVPEFVKINLETMKKIARKKTDGTQYVFLKYKTASNNYITQELIKCLESVRCTRMELQSSTQRTLVRNRWGLITECLDRMFAVIFIFITFSTIYWCLIASRNSWLWEEAQVNKEHYDQAHT